MARRNHSKNYSQTEDYYSMDEDSSLAAAIRDSSAHRDSSLSSVYRESALASAYRESSRHRFFSDVASKASHQQKLEIPTESFSFKSPTESKQGFWSVLAKKAKSALFEEGNPVQMLGSQLRDGSQVQESPANIQPEVPDGRQRQADAPVLQKGVEAIASSLTFITGSIGNALEEGLSIVESKASDIISDTRRRSLKIKADTHETLNAQRLSSRAPNMATNQETQLKASRDVAMAMAAKAKLLLRELKTIKADLAFARERCGQLEEENKVLRDSLQKGDRPDEDDLIRLQLETLLAEKSRLAQENSNYARENRFLRQIVEYHQLTMQDVVLLDESTEDVTEIGLDPVAESQMEMLTLEKSIDLDSAAETQKEMPDLEKSISTCL